MIDDYWSGPKWEKKSEAARNNRLTIKEGSKVKTFRRFNFIFLASLKDGMFIILSLYLDVIYILSTEYMVKNLKF